MPIYALIGLLFFALIAGAFMMLTFFPFISSHTDSSKPTIKVFFEILNNYQKRTLHIKDQFGRSFSVDFGREEDENSINYTNCLKKQMAKLIKKVEILSNSTAHIVQTERDLKDDNYKTSS